MAKGIKTGGGSRKGKPNKATVDIRAAAQEYTLAAIRRLATLAGLVGDGSGKAESETAQVMASNALLDRGHGKAMQSMDVTVRRPSELSDAELAASLADIDSALGIVTAASSGADNGAGETHH